jgi:hypothetical protein
MKKLLIILTAVFFFFNACKKTEMISEPDPYFGIAKVYMNGGLVNFNKCAGGFLDGNPDSLVISLERWDGLLLKETIGFIKLSKNIGRQKVYKINYLNTRAKSASTYTTLREDGDVICDLYQVLESDSVINK